MSFLPSILVALSGIVVFPVANGKPGFVVGYPFHFFWSYDPTFRNTPPQGVKPPCFGRSAFTGIQLVGVQRVAFLLVLVLCLLVCAGPVVPFEGVLSCHTLPMVPTVH